MVKMAIAVNIGVLIERFIRPLQELQVLSVIGVEWQATATPGESARLKKKKAARD